MRPLRSRVYYQENLADTRNSRNSTCLKETCSFNFSKVNNQAFDPHD